MSIRINMGSGTKKKLHKIQTEYECELRDNIDMVNLIVADPWSVGILVPTTLALLLGKWPR